MRWTRPQGGLFLWVTPPERFDTSELLQEALKEKVAFVPRTSFHPNGAGRHTMRLNFSHLRPEVIEEGSRRLGDVVARRLGA